ncbi:hypothetical protein [Hymenobacter frigidus]|uniref:hypothetical protein n=1 Tax=Hymenobacter frigidus TaxID=1524095 RepID=UPI001E3BC6CC|nr:hypothetical protein [Hymenobacter frigidus]
MKKNATSASKLGLQKEVIAYLMGGAATSPAFGNLVTTTSSTPICMLYTDQL